MVPFDDKSPFVTSGIRIGSAAVTTRRLKEDDIHKIEDFGYFILLTTKMGQLTIMSKINREIEIANDKVKLHFPPEKCCVYQNNKLI